MSAPKQRGQWQPTYFAALIETDAHRLEQRIDEAVSAIDDRLEQLRRGEVLSSEERSMIEEALRILKALQQEPPTDIV
jgi:CBS domain containing-hemolysin-like protein